MRKLFYGLCYLIYRNGKKYLRDREIEELKRNSTLSQETIIGVNGSIYNCRSKESVRVGNKTILEGQLLTFRHGGEIIIGDFCYIGERTKIWSAKKILIGDRVLIAHNVNIHDQNSHPLNSVERHLDQVHILEKGFQENIDLQEREIVIKDDAWIGFNSTILKGVTIGRGAIVGACTLITHDIPDFAVVVGNPAKIIKYTI